MQDEQEDKRGAGDGGIVLPGGWWGSPCTNRERALSNLDLNFPDTFNQKTFRTRICVVS